MIHKQELLNEWRRGDVKGLYGIGENPLMADVHMNHTKKLFEKLDFLIVQDIFLTETAKLADVVLPARSWGEVDGTYTNTDRRVQRVRKAVEPHPNTKDDWEILCDLSTRMGYPMSYNSSEEIWDEMRSLLGKCTVGFPMKDWKKNIVFIIHVRMNHIQEPYLHTRFHEELENKAIAICSCNLYGTV